MGQILLARGEGQERARARSKFRGLLIKEVNPYEKLLKNLLLLLLLLFACLILFEFLNIF